MVNATREVREKDASRNMPPAAINVGPATNWREPKILYVVSMFPCWSETFIVREMQVLIDQGVDVHVLSLRKWNETFRQSDTNNMLHRVTYPPSWFGCALATGRIVIKQPRQVLNDLRRITRSLWRRPFELAKTLAVWLRVNGVNDKISRLRPDHVHAHWATYPSTAALFLRERLTCSFSFTAHAHDIFLHDHLLSEKFRAASFVATISDFNRRLLRERNGEIAEKRMEIVRCGVMQRKERSQEIRKRPGAGEMFRIVSVGRLDEIKGFPVLLEACRLLDTAGVSYECDIAGDGPLEPELRRLIKQYGLQRRVHLHGALPSTQVSELLGNAEIFVLASQRARDGNMDGIPVALMEAMSAGLPCVSTAISGIPELIIDGVNGLLIQPGDAQALAEAIQRLLENPALAERLASNAKTTVESGFNTDSEAKKLLSLFLRAIAERDRSKVCAAASLS